MTETTENQPEVEMQVAVIEPTIRPEVARLTYKFIMPSLVARLYLYLFGEFDKDVIELAVEKISEYNTVPREILSKEKGPLRAIYDYLIDKEILEDQNLSEAAMEYINAHDDIQLRLIVDDMTTEE